MLETIDHNKRSTHTRGSDVYLRAGDSAESHFPRCTARIDRAQNANQITRPVNRLLTCIVYQLKPYANPVCVAPNHPSATSTTLFILSSSSSDCENRKNWSATDGCVGNSGFHQIAAHNWRYYAPTRVAAISHGAATELHGKRFDL